MTAISISTILPSDTPVRTSFTDPTGTYYMVGTPSVALAADLVTMKIRRVVFSARSAGSGWTEAHELLENAGIETVAHFVESD